MDRDIRQQRLLETIIHEYIQTARPVSSLALVEECGFDFSPATIRNDMAELEEKGLIMQPHTSSGRVPTEKGYHFYIQHFLHHRPLSKSDRSKLEKAAVENEQHAPEHIRNIARVLAEVTEETVFIASQNGDYVMAGLSSLFQKPDFTDMEQLLSVSEAFDHFDEIVEDTRHQLKEAVQIFIGDENPFSSECAMIVTVFAPTRHALPREKGESILGIVGPMRMNYSHNMAIINYFDELLHERH